MHIVEVFEDGTEEHLSQCMELDTAALEAEAAPPIQPAQPAPPTKPQPLVKLLQCKPSVPNPNLMLWVDGCLTPALPHPLFIDLSAANNPTGGGASSSSDAADGDDAEMGAPADSMRSAAETHVSPAVSAAAAAAVRRAAEDLKRARHGAHGMRIDVGWTEEEALGPRASNTSSTRELGEHQYEPLTPADEFPPSHSFRDSNGVVEHATGRSSSVELSPPMMLGKSPCTKRTRPASACAGCGSSSEGVGAGGEGGMSASGVCLPGEGEDGLGELVSTRGSVLGLSEVMGDWQLESPSKRPALLSPASDRLLSPPILSANSSHLRHTPGAEPPPPARPSAARPAPPARPPTAAGILRFEGHPAAHVAG